MPDKIIKKDQMKDFIQELCANYSVYAPIRDEQEVNWSKIDNPDQVVFEFTNTALSPKEFFFPQSECMLSFKNESPSKDPEAMIMKEQPGLIHNQALMNIRPCDAKAFEILDKVFCKDEKTTDVYWKDKRDKTAVIGLACSDPCPTCFCSSVNCGPHNEEGMDVLLKDLGDVYLARPITEKGEKMLGGFEEADQKTKQQGDKQKEDAEAKIESKVLTDNILSRTTLEEYEHSYWERVFETCINCGTCTFFCPTCHCFDIQDEVQDEFGRRVRNWDTCMSWLFTHHTSGHNPRGSKKDRVRQRFMHKFKYMPYKLQGDIGCVGCGRCTYKCPVNIDVREVVNKMNE